MRVLLVWVIFAGCLLLAGGCDSGKEPSAEAPGEGGSPQKIALWALETKDPRQSVLQESIRMFNEANRHIQIVPYFYETEAYKNKLRVAMVSGNMPDLFYYWTGANFKAMVESQVVADLSPLLDQYPDFKGQFIAESLESSTFQGHIYGIPNAVNHVVIWYNRQIFDQYGLKPPETWQEMLDIVQQLSGKGITPFAMAGKERWPVLQWIAYLSERTGGDEPFERAVKREGDFTDPSFVDAGLRFHELVRKKAFAPAFLGMDVNEAERSFLAGETAMYMQGDWAAGKLLGQKNSIGYFPFPTVNGKGDRSAFYGGYSAGFAISAGRNEQASFEVLTYLMGREQRKIFTEYTGLVSPIEHLPISKNEAMPDVYDYVQYIEKAPTRYFGFYDQVLEPGRAQQLMDAAVTFAGEEEMSREEIEAVLSQIR